MTATLTRTVVERPILFAGPMVRATLEGRKTQTRRVIVPVPPPATVGLAHLGGTEWACVGNNGPNRKCRYGAAGDRLWVKETWFPRGDELSAIYRADVPDGRMEINGRSCWRGSVIMPRRFSRLTLQLTGVRVERVQDISAADCRAEGVEVLVGDDVVPPGTSKRGDAIYRDAYARLWNSLNAARGYGWKVNPWVWVLTFTKVTP